MRIASVSIMLHNAFTRRLVRDLVILILLSLVSVCLAYQARFSIKMDIGSDNRGYATGFYFVQREGERLYRWTGGNGRVLFPDVGKATPLLLTVRAYAWRDADRVYTATVTVNGSEVGAITKAGWGNWRFLVSNPAMLHAEELVVGIHSVPFIPAELYPEAEDTRELGVAVESVEIQPQWSPPVSPEGWLDLVTIPSGRQLLFVILLVPGLYLFCRLLGMREQWAFYIGISAIALFAVGIVLFRLAASERTLIVTLAVGIAILVRSFLGQLSQGSKEGSVPLDDRDRLRLPAMLGVSVCIALVAFLLRWHALAWLDVEHDDRIYMSVAEHYAQALRLGDWSEVIAYNGVIEHPRLYVLLFGVSLVIRDIANAPLSNEVAMRLLAAILGSLQAGLITMLNPLAGWFLAIQTTEIKFTSMAYLEALPALTSALSVLSFERFRRTSNESWMYLSAISLGATGASKFIYLTAGLAILPFLLWERRRQPTKIIIYGFLATLAFFALDPYLWLDPIGRLRGMLSFHSEFSQSDWVKLQNLPGWYTLFTLSRSVSTFPAPLLHEHPPMFFLEWDGLIYVIGILGLPALWRRSRLYIWWFLFGVAFLVFWNAKWEQYALIIAFPLLLSAGCGVSDFAIWLKRRWWSNRPIIRTVQ